MYRSFNILSYIASACHLGQTIRESERFPDCRGLSRLGKMKREERDLCRLPTSCLINSPTKFLVETYRFSKPVFTITAEIHARSLANFYCQYADRHINLKLMRRVSERERAIRQFVIVKNKLMSVFNASVVLLIMNFVITLSK